MEIRKFKDLTKEEKVDFFTRCQSILLRNHPESEFLVNDKNIEEKKIYSLEFIKKYKGFVYWDDNLCVLFNKIDIKDPQNPKIELKNHIYKESDEPYNCILIDFAIFSKLFYCLNFLKSLDAPQVKYALFVKNNEVKLYDAKKLLAKVQNLSPIILENLRF